MGRKLIIYKKGELINGIEFIEDISRINYEPNNLRWATPKQQANNTCLVK